VLTFINTTEVENAIALATAVMGAVAKHSAKEAVRDDARWALWYLMYRSEGATSFLLMRFARVRKPGNSNLYP